MKDISKGQFHQLVEIGITISAKKEINELISFLLKKSAELTKSQGSRFYIVQYEKAQDKTKLISLGKKPTLRLVKSFHCIHGLKDHKLKLSIDDKSLAGLCFLEKTVLQKYSEKEEKVQPPPSHSQSKQETLDIKIDAITQSKAKSFLTLPIETSTGKVSAVLQLINKEQRDLKKNKKTKKESKNPIIYFTNEDKESMKIILSYVSISMENSQLTESIENLFESFVRASVKAIESRDPTTRGHSDRVAMMTVDLAIATHQIKEGPYKGIEFSEDQIKEIRYASLLHDFGKIGVNESVLLKKKKLKEENLEAILNRLDGLIQKEENKILKRLFQEAIEKRKGHNTFNIEEKYKKASQSIQHLRFRIQQMRENILVANQPQILSSEFDINQLMEKLAVDNAHFNHQILNKKEMTTLSISQGSLTKDERREIESHVEHTYEFLKQIIWTGPLTHVCAIARSHHEKMDGSGYPQGLSGYDIPIQSRMMTIADIYDALTAFDRPYKKSISSSRALEILIQDARSKKLDGHLLKIFIESGVFYKSNLGRKKVA